MTDLDDEKYQASVCALEHIQPDMIVGLGTGSTAEIFVNLLGEKVAQGLKIVGIPTSKKTAELAEKLGIPLTELTPSTCPDITIDGADEVDSKLRLIKGGGGALLREKIVASSSKKMIVIADSRKKVDTLGQFRLPVEIITWSTGIILAQIIVIFEKYSDAKILDKNQTSLLRKSKEGLFTTDQGNFIVDLPPAFIHDPESLAQELLETCGVVEHGLFLTEAERVFIGSKCLLRFS